jgi:hypothetical protein
MFSKLPSDSWHHSCHYLLIDATVETGTTPSKIQHPVNFVHHILGKPTPKSPELIGKANLGANFFPTVQLGIAARHSIP